MVIVIGRGLSVIKRCATFLPQYCISQIEQTMVLTYLDSCPVVWSSTSSKDLEKWQLVQNRAAWLKVITNGVRNFPTLKNKYLKTSSCVNHIHTLPPKLSSVIKKFGSGLIFCFHIRSMHLDWKGWGTHTKNTCGYFRLGFGVCNDLYSEL